MAVIVIGGHSRSVGKTAVVAGLIARLSGAGFTAFKLTQFGHGFCSASGEPCDCATAAHNVAFSDERDPGSGTDTGRYLAAGAVRSVWVRVRQGHLGEAMPRLRRELAAARNAIVESNSLVGLYRPDLYLSVLDPATADFKESARLFLGRADALLVHGSAAGLEPLWPARAAQALERPEQRRFRIAPPEYVTEEVAEFVRARLG